MASKLQANSKVQPWLADFSSTMRIFTVIVVAEMMVVVYSLSFMSFEYSYWNQLAMLSMLAQLIAISVIVLLTWLRTFFNRFNVFIGVGLVLLTTWVLATAYTQLMGWMDQVLMFDLIDNSRLTALKISVATAMTVLALMRYFYVQDQWAGQVAALSKAQLHALQARIKPHFLYNSLNSIATLISVDPPAAEKAVINLSSLFRRAFSNQDKNMTTLDEELAWAKEYLAIEKLRLMDRLTVEWDIDAALMDTQVPLLSIQPLIENAVIHGIQHLTDGGTIHISVQATTTGFRVSVSNPYRPEKIKSGANTGLANIRQRLNLVYGNRVTMQVAAGDQFEASWEVSE